MNPLEDIQQSFTLAGALDDIRRVRVELLERDPFHTAALVGGLLTVPELHASCVRLETLVTLSVAVARGPRIPKIKQIAPWYELLGRGQCGLLEDPPEDVFIGLADGRDHTYRLFEGIWEGNAFYVSMFLKALAAMPDGDNVAELTRQVTALLRLSDLVAARSRLQRYTAGSSARPRAIPVVLHEQTALLRARVCFTDADLVDAAIDKCDLAPFIFDMRDAPELVTQKLGHTRLERSPILVGDGQLALVLPTAVGAAVRRHVIETMISSGLSDALVRALADAHGAAIADARVLGEVRGMPTEFRRSGRFLISECELPIDDAHVVQFILVADDLSGYADRGFTGFNSDPTLSSSIGAAIQRCALKHSSQPGFRQGVSIVVMCGWGRGFSSRIGMPKTTRWYAKAVPTHDLMALSMMEDMSARRLFAMLQAKRDLETIGVELVNANGLLALAAWGHSLGGHLVPHARMAPEEDGDAEHLIHVDQDALWKQRVLIAQAWDRHRIEDVSGRLILVMRESPFVREGNGLAPLYASLDDVAEDRLRAVATVGRRAWWASIATPPGASRNLTYNLWLAIARWVERLAPVLERWLPGLPIGPYEWRVVFEDIDLEHDTDLDAQVGYQQLVDFTRISSDLSSRLMTITCARGFVYGFRSSDNIAERALLRSLVQAAHRLAAVVLSEDRIEELVDEVMHDQQARSMHGFAAHSFHDHVRDAIPSPIVIDPFDDAASRINLGWLARQKSEGASISGVVECVAYLDRLVDGIWNRLKDRIGGLNRSAAISKLLLSHEAAYSDAQRWRRTFFAVRSLHDDKEVATRRAAEHLARLSAADLACRLLVEICNCEAPQDGQRKLGDVELGGLMADVMLLHYMGNYRDAIRFGAMEPTIRISPAGDVLMNHDFSDTVVSRLGYIHQTTTLAHEAKHYRRMYTPTTIEARVEGCFDADFMMVWTAEFQATLDQFRAFVDALEDEGVRRSSPVLAMRRSEIISSVERSHGLAGTIVAAILDRLTLATRACWHQSPPGFSGTAWHPWRFGRQLSLLSRPMVMTELSEDPQYLVAPGLVRLALVYMLGGSHEAGLDNKYFATAAMRSWIGRKAERRGHEFNLLVEERLKRLGWKTRANLKLDGILNMKLDLDYGDVDVLAWREEDARVLCIECKRLNKDMTVGQIAERLAEYRGEDDSKGKPDRLKRHVRRLVVLGQHEPRLRKFIGADRPVSIVGGLIFDDHTPMGFRRSPAMHGMVVCRLDDIETVLARTMPSAQP